MSNHLKAATHNGQNEQQRGFLSVELGLVLLVAAILTAGAVVLFNNNLRQTSISDNVQDIQTIAGAAKANFGAKNQYGVVTTAVAVRAHLIPDALRDGQAATATNKFGGAITVAPANGTGTNDMLALTWPNVPAIQCFELVNGVNSAMRRITVGATVVKALDGTLNQTTLTTACETNTSDGNVQLVFDIGRS